jgi:hypothetical protein
MDEESCGKLAGIMVVFINCAASFPQETIAIVMVYLF